MRSVAALIVALAMSGCALRPAPRVVYVEVPEGYLQPCTLPPVPANNAELSDAFVIAYKCAEQGNTDKERIRNLPRD